jgi:hypothetical protein
VCHEIRDAYRQGHDNHADKDAAPRPAHSRLPAMSVSDGRRTARLRVELTFWIWKSPAHVPGARRVAGDRGNVRRVAVRK